MKKPEKIEEKEKLYKINEDKLKEGIANAFKEATAIINLSEIPIDISIYLFGCLNRCAEELSSGPLTTLVSKSFVEHELTKHIRPKLEQRIKDNLPMLIREENEEIIRKNLNNILQYAKKLGINSDKLT